MPAVGRWASEQPVGHLALGGTDALVVGELDQGKILKRAEWHTVNGLRQTFPHASIVGEEFIFNVGGNKFRVICHI